ncbi:MAG: deoxyribose-phosphate aldolase [Gammaproteobacteria bacterium]|nr:MAG: deoxyribose-phosphate aldolase [Gammaproteobacteria bacterium]
MNWSDVVKERVQTLTPVNPNQALIDKLFNLIDLTSLNESDTDSSIAALCEKATSPFGHVAAVCVYPRFVRLVAEQFASTPIKTAAVANFPHGTESLESTLIDISQALQEGAQEIDVVFPYTRYLAGERQYAQQFVTACKAACGEEVTLKVIIETGALNDPAIIADASLDVLTAGADFIKTSTGKIAEGATLEAAATMLLVIQHATPLLKRPLGLKISGGIREVAQAAQYVELADQIMGRDWVTPQTFRIGASKLVEVILASM